jgi:hypothetical protein
VSLKSSHQEFDSVNVELAKVRKNLKALQVRRCRGLVFNGRFHSSNYDSFYPQWQARQDRVWIAAGIALLTSTVLYIMHQRTGLLLI